MSPSRRAVLQGAALAALAATCPGLSLAAAPTDRRLVVILLRGALDGLAAVPPVGDPRHVSARGPAAVVDGVLPLDDLFGLHPALGPLSPLWEAGELGVVHAVGNPLLDRSHFDAQRCLENGTPQPFGTRTGWLGRALAALPDGPPALAVGRAVPLILRGPAPVTSADPLRDSAPDPELLASVEALYADDPELGSALRAAVETNALLEPHRQRVARRGGGQLGDLQRAAGIVGGVLADPAGPRVAVLEAGGWDTHAGQAGTLDRMLGGLAEGLLALRDGLGGAWSDTAVLVLTEFGRTVAGNGTGGTDHGTASAALLVGGAVAGGVQGTWPGLDRPYEGRDLTPTTDLRSLLKGVLAGHLGVGEGALEDRVFPDSRDVPRLEGLTRA